MIDLYTSTTPNGRKASIMLEEIALPYTLHALDPVEGRPARARVPRHQPQRAHPRHRRPPTRPGAPFAVFDSWDILIYLAEKTGKLLAPSGQERYAALEWVMFQMSAVGPMFGQYFATSPSDQAAEKLPYAIERYQNESLRILAVLDGRLGTDDHLAGVYSFADVCTYAWVAGIIDRLGDPGFPYVRAWLDRVGARPGGPSEE